ncbi:hypothetical protein C5708_15900 [Caulobacter sp. CCUG 60055]|uniref:hypothetical protein n=1 Tax=Caulobacter sp. CCUG 60055 TaxID=2100090 RepID=UPI001FA6B3C6|nr:hypothetical protein [Caulobacter sp. CCUG 60055]MBQ1542192.1 hypothetical protein [Caulobacteraceae bacterium]MCI3181730.1 hypothetical protein [Caulobacter sp. CCUG 60055]
MGKPWFRVKRYGFGAGLPCSWEGWVVVALYVAAMALTVTLFGSSYAEQHPWRYFAAVIGLTALVVFISWRKSDGPWRWRNGDDR